MLSKAKEDISVAGTLLGDRRLLDLLSEAVTWSKRSAPSGGPTGGFGLSVGPTPRSDRPVHARDFTNWELMLSRPVSLAGDSGIDLVAQRLVEMLRDWTDPALRDSPDSALRARGRVSAASSMHAAAA